MPNGNSQGIVVPIQAKIEGWQEQIKQIQNALQQMMKGSDISKGLEKDLKRVTSMVDNFAKNANQRLTSDSQITAFTDKLRAVDEIFSSMGAKMSSISFGDLDVDYVTKNFQDLITQIEAAEEALSKGMESSFQEAIKGSDSLQKTFSKFEIDPKKFSIKELGEELQSRFKSTSDQLDELNRKFTETSARISGLREEAAEYSKTVKDIGDPTALAKSIIGDTSQLGVSKELNVDFLKDLSAKLSGVLTGDDSKFSDTLKARKEEISKALSELVDAKSIDEARAKLQALYDLIPQNMRGLFDFKVADFKAAQEQLVQIIPDEAVISQKMQGIREALSKYKINEKDLDGIMLKAKDLVREGDFDSLPKIIGDALRRTKDIAEAEVPKIQDKIKELVKENKDRNTQIFQTASTKTGIEKSIQDYNKIIDERVKAEVEPLRKEVAELRARLEQKATEHIRNIGFGTKSSADQGLTQSTSQAKAYEAQLARVKAAEQGLGKLQGVVQRWFSIYAVIRMVRQAINSMISTIKELDKTITNIAIVTKMDQDDLWGQMPKYTAMAREYAASISGVYEVSQLYYQQGLQMADVMALTEQTLKMARISGLGYSDSTNYMTNAVRSFKMEMQDSQRVVDVYSAIAAKSATSVSELANAMSKTASSAQAVGSSFENTTAMMAVMIEATRESAENIGSALKSIISRYGEMKSDPTKLVDSEGEEMSLNKVDKALKTVGITIKDSAGQFRDFDDVIMELSSKWDTIDKNTQRYIATIMAGNRQQSRFLALVSSYDRLKELSSEAANSEDASQLQFLKSLDSVDAKVQQLQTSIQALYTNSGLENIYKGILDFANRIVTTLDNISNNQGLLGVVSKIGAAFTTLATLITNAFTTVKLKFSIMQSQMTANAQVELAKRAADEKLHALQEEEDIEKKKILWQEYQAYKTKVQETEDNKRLTSTMKASSKGKNFGMMAGVAGMLATSYAASLDVNTDRTQKSLMTGLGGILSGVGTGFMVGGLPGIFMGIATAIPSVLEAVGMATESTSEKLDRLKKNIETTSNDALKSKSELKTLADYKERYDELSKKQYESAEDRKAFLDLNNEIAASYPELISSMDAEGNSIVNMTTAYQKLAEAKMQAYKNDFIKNLNAELEGLGDIDFILNKYYGQDLFNNKNGSILDFVGMTGSKLSNLTSSLTLDTSKERADSIKSWITWDSVKELINEDAIKAAPGGKPGLATGNNDLWYKYDYGFTGLLTSDVLTGKGQEIYSQMVSDFFDLAQQGVSLIDAKDILSKKEIYSDYISQVNGFKESVYNVFLAESDALELQQTLIENKLKSSAAQWTNILGETTGKKATGFQSSVISRTLYDRWNSFYEKVQKGEITKYTKVGTKKDDGTIKTTADLYNEFLNEYSTQWYFGIEEATHFLQEDSINKLYENRGKYSLNQIKNMKAFSRLGEYQQDFIDAYNEQYKDVYDNYNNFLNVTLKDIDDQPLKDTLTSLKELVGPEFLSGIVSQYDDILDNTSFSDEHKSQMMNTLATLYSSITKITDPDISAGLISKFVNSDFTSITGIHDAIEYVKSLHLDSDIESGLLSNLSLLVNLVQSNIVTELEQLTTKIVAQFKEFDSAVSKAAKGMDLSDAVALAEKVGTTLNDPAFQFKNGKYYFTNIQALKEAYVKENDALYADLEAELKDQQALASKEIRKPSSNKQFNQITRVNILDDISKLRESDWWGDIDQRIEQIQKLYGLSYEQAAQMSSWYDSYYNTYLSAIKTEGSGYSSNTTFSQYITSELAKSKENLEKAKEQYGTYQVNSILLQNGQIEEFIRSVFGDEKYNKLDDTTKQAYIKAVSTGDIDNLPAELQDYAALIYDTYHSIRSSIANAMIASVNGNGSNKIKVTETNAAELKKLQDKGLITGDITAGNYVTIAAEKLSSNASEFLQYVVESFDTTSEQIKALAEYHKNKYSNSQTTGLNNVLDKSVFSYEDLLTYMVNNHNFDLTKDLDTLPQKMAEIGLAFNSAGEVYVKNYDLWILDLKREVEQLEKNPAASQEEINNAKAKLDAARTKQTRDRNKAIKDIISNSNEVSEEQRQALADSLGMDYDAVSKYFIKDFASGTSRLDLATLQADIDSGKLKVSDATKQALSEQINSIYDNAINYMSTATNLMSGGTTSQDEMQKFADKMQELQAQGYLNAEESTSVDTLFSYDTVTKAYKLNADAWDKYLTAEKQRLAALGFETNEIQNILVKNAAEGVDISSFLKAENRGQGSAARTTLKGQLQAWLTTKYGQAADDTILEYYANKISNGGKDAVEVIKQLAQEEGREATSEEIQQAYRAKVTDLQNASGQIADIVIGSNIGTSGKLFDILNELHMVDPTTGVVNSTYDAIKAYEKIYEEMAKTSEATTSDLNTAYADLITANQQQEINALNILKNATNINSHDLGASLASGKTPHKLSDYLDQNGNVKTGVSWLKALGADQYMITDFDQYAGIQGWEFGSEAYNQAYVDWQESMKEYQRRGEKYLNAGNISGFLQVTGHKGDTALAAKIAKGETDALPADLQQYAAAIENNYRSVRESIANALIDAVGDGSKIITVTEQNIEELQKLKDKGWITGDVAVGKNITIAAEKLAENSDEYIQYLIDSFDSTAEQIKALGQNHANKYSKSRSTGLNKVIDKQTIAYEDLLSYMNSNHGMEINAESIKQLPAYMEAMGLAFNNAGEAYIKDYDKWIANLEWDVQQLSQSTDASPEEINAAKARLASAKTQQTRARNEAIQGMISNYNSITSEQQEALANALGKDYDEVSKYLEFDEASGTSHLDLAALKADIDNGTLEVSDATKNILSEQINSIYDEAVNYMSTAATFMGSGTVNQTDMQKFTQKMEELFSQGYLEGVGTTTDYFSYDSITKAYKLNSDAWQEYVQAEKKRLAALGFETAQIQSILTKQAADNVDVTGFLQASNKAAGSIARSKLQGELQTWLTAKWGQAANQSTLEFYTQMLEAGGEVAITAMEEIAADAGRELSTDEIKAAYRAQVEPIVSLVESLDSIKVGSIVDKNQITALKTAGFTVNEQGLVTAVGDLAEAYKSLYVQMKATAEATTAELNSTLGKYLDNRSNGGTEQAALEALSKAAEMTYSDFLQLYTDVGIELTEAEFNALESAGKIKALGGNKMQITDFAYIAEQLGWETGGDAYKAGYSAYVDSLIQERNKYNVDSRAATQISNLASAKVGQEVNIYDIPDSVKEALGLAGQETYTVTSEAARDTMLLMMAEAIDDATLENNPQLKSQIYALKEEILAKRNRHAGLTGILGDNVSLADAESFAVSTGFDKEMTRGIMEARGYIWDAYTQTFTLTNDAIAAAYGEIEMAKDFGATDKTINELTAAADDLAYTLSYGEKNNAIIEALQNYTNLSNEAVATLKTAFKDELTDTDWQKILTYDETSGTSKVNIKEFVAKLNELRATTQVVFNEAIQAELTNLTDSYFNDISSGIGMVHEGTTSQADMLDMAKKINEATGQTLSVGDYFKYDVNLQTFTLSADAMRQYVEAQRSVFEALGITGEALDRYIKDQTSKLLATKLDFSSFYAASDRSGSSKVTQELVKAYRDWYESKNNQLLTTEMIQSFINTIDKGGTAAVEKIKEIKGSDASSDELVAAYNAQIDRLRNAMADVGKQVGETVTGDSIRILEAAGYSLQLLDDGTAVITAVGDMVAAYNLIYNRMKEVSEATTADLNEAYANALTANEQADIDAINALGDAMGMTYNALGEYLAKYGQEEYKDLEYAMAHMNELGIEKIGAGKIRIKDFDAFAGKMGWDQGSEEYVSAFKTYNDSLIKLNRRREKDIIAEVNDVAEAKAGDKVNLTEFANYFDESVVNELLMGYGASIKEGILTLEDNANIPGIISQLGTLAYQAGIMLPEEMAALEDTVIQLLSDMTSMIGKGISGELSNSEALNLTNWARQTKLINADQNLTFVKTANGLKLVNSEAIKLYGKIKQIDGLQGQIVFDKLKESLEENDEHYQSMTSTLARIKELRELKDTADPTKREQYEAELEVAEEIARVRATSEDDSFNFMSNKIPGAQNNPLNYFENWGKAWKTLQDSFKGSGKDKGKIEYQDFYNIMTEMGHLAEISGQPIKVGANEFVTNAEDAAKLIEKGAASLSVAADGSIKVDLSKFGMNFTSGAKDMAANVQDGIQEMAQSQIDMLDSMISLLEVIVAMEGLQDVDVDNDMVIEVPEIALETKTGEDGKEYIKKFTQEYTDFTDQVLALAKDNPDLKKGLDNVKVNGHTMTEILGATEDQLERWKISAETVSQLMTALLTLTTSDLYDTDDIWNSFMQIFSGLNLGDTVLEVNGGKHSIVLADGGEYSINWDSAVTKANIERAVKNGSGYATSEELQEIAQAAWDKLKAGDTITIEENYALQLATGEITVIPASGDQPVRYKVGNQTYTDQKAAVRAATLTRAGATVNKPEENASGTPQETVTIDGNVQTVDVSYGKIKLGDREFEVFSTGDGKVYYKVGGTNYNTREEAFRALFEQENEGLSAQTKGEDDTLVDTPEYINWKKEVGITVEPLVTITNEAKITKDVQHQAQEKIAKALKTGNGEELISYAKTVGIELGAKVTNTKDLTVDEVNQIYQAFGIESKSVSLDATVTASGNEKVVSLIETGNADVTITATIQKAGEDNIENPEAPTVPDITIDADIEGVKSKFEEIKKLGETTKPKVIVEGDNKLAKTAIDDTKKYAASNPASQSIIVNNNNVWNAISNNVSKGSSNPVQQNINVGTNSVSSAIDSNVIKGKNNPVRQSILNSTRATGDVGATGNAMAGGTLMGELGPELVVQGGRYFVAGQNGAEFVNLTPDAIVFNHLQTEQLLDKGMSSSRGKAVTNERVAVAYATGNVNGGPAMASASAALAALKQLRAMWQALMNSSLKDLAGKGGGGGGGGGGDKAARQAWITQVERWYNLMQKIAQCEKDITHEETLRTKLNSDFHKNGKAYYESQVRSLQTLQEQMIAQEELNISQKEYFNQRREQLNTANGPFNQWYSFDENGQLKYNDDYEFTTKDGEKKKGAFNFMSELMTVDEMGKPKYTVEEQYNALVAAGFKDFMQYDTSGKEITLKEGATEEEKNSFYSASVQALWEHMDSQREEMQNLHNTIEEGENQMLELQTAQNEILEEIRNNQLAVEDSILEAIIDQRQRAIDNLSNERSALEESASKFIEGLTDALNKEKNLYSINQDDEELNKLRRQLSILKRSGGSGSEIRSLEDQINSKEKDLYFEKQQEEIEAIQTASDLQLERLDAQIDLMTKTLEYEKEHGMLWADVYQVMAKSPGEITEFIMTENSKYWSMSPLKTEEELQNALFQAEQWTSFRDGQATALNAANEALANEGVTIGEAVYGKDNSWSIFTTAMNNLYGEQWRQMASDYKTAFETKMAQTGDITKATTDLTNSLSALGDKLVSALSTPAPVSSGSGGSGDGGDTGDGGNGGGNGGGGSGGTWQNVGSPSGWQRNSSQHWKEQKQRNSKTGAERTVQVQKGAHNKSGKPDYRPGVSYQYCTCGKLMQTINTNTGKRTNYAHGNLFMLGHHAFSKGALLGELGPELIASQGQTYLAGMNGAEMINLPDDAIIFNHLQTAQLLGRGKTGRGTPIKSEEKSAGYNSIMSKWFWDNTHNIQASMLSFASGTIPTSDALSSINNISDNVIVENAVVNMNVSQIANDYDAQRAGEQAMSKILEIARKTSAKNSIRR